MNGADEAGVEVSYRPLRMAVLSQQDLVPRLDDTQYQGRGNGGDQTVWPPLSLVM